MIVELRVDFREKMQIDLLAHGSEADHSLGPQLGNHGAEPMKQGGLAAPLRLRARIIASRESFDLEQFTAFRRRLHSIRDVVLVSSTITVWLRLIAPDFGWHGQGVEAQVDWARLERELELNRPYLSPDTGKA